MNAIHFPLQRVLISCAAALIISSSIAAQSKTNWTVDFNDAGSFIENKGQFYIPGSTIGSADVLYAIDDGNTRVFFTKRGVSILMTDVNKRKKTEEEKAEELRSDVKCKTNRVTVKNDYIHMNWINCNPDVQVVVSEQTADYHSYSVKDFSGNWINTNNIPGYRKLTYLGIYPGIDIEYTIHPDQGFKYSLIVHPGADVSKFKMQYTDVDGMSVDPSGNLLIPSLFGNVIDHAPVSFYAGNKASITSSFQLENKVVTFEIGNYDPTKTIIIDPWTVTPAFGNCNKIWECEHDAAGNAYLYGGDTPMRLRKYNSAGAIQWTFNTAWDTTGYWVGSFVTDQAGNSYCTSGSNGEIVKVSTAGAQQWFNNPNGAFGPLFEYWHLTLNCDETQLVVGGMRAPNPFSIGNYRGAVMNINLANGAVLGFVPVGWVAGINIKEVKSITWSPNGNYYFLTLDSVGCVTPALALSWKTISGYGFSYGTCGYGVTNQGISAIRCTASDIYTQNGTTVHRRNIANGAITATATIPGGATNSSFGNSPLNSGLDLDNCGNVYAGSSNQVVKYDAALNQLATSATTAAVYDVSVTLGGEVIVCGPGYASSINMSACAPVSVVCGSSPLSTSQNQTNISCFGQCTGQASVTASGGNGVYTYAWLPSGGTGSTATGLCSGTYTCTVTDGLGATTTATFNITQPASALSATGSSTNPNCSGGTGSATVTASGGTSAYTYAWTPSGGTASTASGLANGNYTCTVTDANGCTTTQSFSITVPPAISGTTSSTAATCGNNNGSAAVSASGGTGGLTYSWAPSGGTGSSATNLTGGNYTVTVTDANGCTNSFTVNVPTSGGPTTGVQSFGDVSCFGGNDGTGTITASGNGPFTYSWAPSGGNAATATNLTAQVYTVTVTDINGCSSTQTVAISEPTAITPTITAFTDATCGNNDGTATASASGGTGAFTYSWAPTGGNAAAAINLGAGIYTVTVTDANNCTSTTTVSISNIGAPTVNTQSLSNVSCFSLSDGSATISATGNGPFTYNWAPTGGNAASATNLAQGVYTVTVTDNGGCTAIHTITITEPTQITGTITPQDATCGNSNGTASITPTGGTGPYTYVWSNSQTTQQITGLAAGSYSVIVTDANGCTSTATTTILNNGAPGIQVTSQSDPTCFNGTNGSATVLASGGTGPYTYNWAPSGGTGASASGLGAGTYTVTVTGADGCTQTQTITLTSPPVIVTTTSSSPDDCNSSNGMAAISVSGGTPGYVLAWSTGSSNDTIVNLSAGSYTCTVTDANGCTMSATVLVGTSGSVTANAGVDVTISQGQTTGLTGNGGISWSWTPAGSLDCATCQNPNATPSVTTTYILTVTDSLGCTDTDTVTVFVDIECGDLFLPTAFSPNGDGDNDIYCVRSNCIKTLQFEIYNRWGEKVFETTDPDICWDGYWRDKPCEAAVFTYFIRGEMLDGTPIDGQGNITLVK
jgi:gliding motility-associated-like protein